MRKVILAFGVCLFLIGAVLCRHYYGELQKSEERQAALQNAETSVGSSLSEKWDNEFINLDAEALFDEKTIESTEEYVAQYRSPEGIRFCSKSAAWEEDELKELYNELLRNQHGDELFNLAQVIVYGEDDEYAAASHHFKKYSYGLRLALPSLPKQKIFTFYRSGGVISLYDGDRKTTAADMAPSLSHEYGHHYTFHYMFERPYGEPVYEGSEYERLRGLDTEKVRTVIMSNKEYYDNHHWYFFEIAAEDYVTLMGSPNARTISDAYDIRERADGREDEIKYGKNFDVQENLLIPMAHQCPGLAEYYCSFIDASVPEFEHHEIEISVEKKSNSYNLTSGYRTFNRYEFSWNKAYGEDAVYTLVAFDEKDLLPHPVRTVSAGEEPVAVVGSYTKEQWNSVSIYDDKIAEGTKVFVVTVILPNGDMYCSKPFYYSF